MEQHGRSSVLAHAVVLLVATLYAVGATTPTGTAQILSAGDRCVQCETFLRSLPLSCEEQCALVWPDYNCPWICSRLQELKDEGSAAPCWDIGYCQEREIRALQEKRRQEEEAREQERLRREAAQAELQRRERERLAKEEEQRRSEEAARLEVERQRKELEAREIEREKKLLRDEWDKVSREKETLERERRLIELERRRISLLQQQQPQQQQQPHQTRQSQTERLQEDLLTPEERQQRLRQKAKEALRTIEERAAPPATSPSLPAEPRVATATASRQDDKTEGPEGIEARPKATLQPSPPSSHTHVVAHAQKQGRREWCTWDCADLWNVSGALTIIIFAAAYGLHVATSEIIPGVMVGGRELAEAGHRKLMLYALQLVLIILSAVLTFFGYMAFRYELAFPLLSSTLGQQCLTVASYAPQQLYLFLFLAGQVGKQIVMTAKAAYDWLLKVKKTFAARRYLRGRPWSRIAKDGDTLRVAECIFLLLFTMDALAPSNSDLDNHACAQVAAFLLIGELVALIRDITLLYPTTFLRQDVLRGSSDVMLSLVLCRLISITRSGGEFGRTLLPTSLLLLRLPAIVELLRPGLHSLLPNSSKQKTS